MMRKARSQMRPQPARVYLAVNPLRRVETEMEKGSRLDGVASLVTDPPCAYSSPRKNLFIWGHFLNVAAMPFIF